MKIKHLMFAALAAFALNQGASAQNIIGVGVPTGTTRNDTYVAAGFEFYAPHTTGTTINALGFWDADSTGLLVAHTVSIFQYSGNGSIYNLVISATVPAGTNAPLINGYRWVGIPTTALPDNGQGGGYYAILATQQQDTWTTGIGSPPYLNPSIGTVSGYGVINEGSPYTLLSSSIGIAGTGNSSDGFGGANLAFLTNQPPSQPAATPILWAAQGTFTDDTVLGLAGAPTNEVYGVDFGAGPQTTANSYTFGEFTNGNMTLTGNATFYGAFLSGGGTTGDSSFDEVLNNGYYGNASIYGTLLNLTIGQKYNVLAIGADTRGGTAQFGISDDLGVSPFLTYEFPGGTPAIGSYILGTFTATGTNQIFTVLSSDVQYHAILVETVPAGAITLVTNTLPTSATAGVGSNVVFTAAFSNTPPVNLQWQFLANGATNNINTGVVTVTNNGIISSTLTLVDLQVSNAGSYRLEAIDTGNSANIANSASAPLTVITLINWYPAGTYNGTFSDNSVLALAGPLANEVYGVDFGGSGLQTTANGYTFNDNTISGNMTVANNPSSYSLYMGGVAVAAGTVTTGDTALDQILTYGLYGQLGNSGTLNNLTVGQTYTVLVLLDDTRGAAAGGSVFHVTDGVTVSPGQRFAFANGSPSVGGYIMGTFTAQATTQPLTILNNPGAVQYNAVLLETGIAPPPPLPPTLTTDVTPLLSEVPVGAPMSFSVAASGSLPISYQWSNQNGKINGATNTSYSFNALPGTNSYSVGITNGHGGIVSSTAVVIGEINAPPLVGFGDGTSWTLNNNGLVTPTLVNGLLELTDGNGGEASSAFYDVGQYVGGFVASFIYQTPSDGGADGATFCLQNSPVGTNALGNSGGGLAYAGIAPSAAFEMNLYTGAAHGGVGIRVGTNGTIGDFSDDGYNSTAPVNYTNGDAIFVELYYLQGVMHVLMIDPTALTTNNSSFLVNVPAAVGNGSAYLGLTGSDGGVDSIQTVSNFLYSYTTPPILSSVTHGAPGQVVVSWPVSVASLFTLVQSSSLKGPWTPAVPLSSAIVGFQNQETLSAGGSAAYYRLQLIDPNAP